MAKQKTEEQLRREMQEKQLKEYLKEYEEAYEKHIEPINLKYAWKVVPVIRTDKYGGMFPAYDVEKYIKIETKPASKEAVPHNEKSLETKTDE
jgi:hypothetical protein